MFHKQNIPSSGPSTTDSDVQNSDTTTNKETTKMSETSQENTFMNTNPNPFQRPTSHATAYGTAETNTSAEGRKLIIGKGITLSGEIENCDQLLVEGTVEATLNGAKLLDIAESGIFYGSVDIEEAVIAGRFEGDLTVDGRVTVTASGTVTGTITYRELTVEAGATIEGKISSFASASNKSEGTAADFSKLKAASKKASDTKKADAA